MQVKSLVSLNNKIEFIDVQVVLLPGLPQIQFLGQADSFIKESSHRIRSAIKNAGYQFPIAQQVLVDLKPHEIKKKSFGLELAVAYCILVLTGQIEANDTYENVCFYGELGLSGEVLIPGDISRFEPEADVVIMTGVVDAKGDHKLVEHISCLKIKNLNHLNQPEKTLADKNFCGDLVRPSEGLCIDYSSEEARVLSFLALSEHSILIAGPAGVGKTTLANHLPSFLKHPSEMKLKDSQFKLNLKVKNWRPSLKPHFTSTVTSLIGGGDPLRPGDLTRAHGGLLILDEFLEFHTSVQEALRTPMEEKKIILSRGSSHQQFQCETLVVATTNLCPCGRWTPDKMISCHYTLKKCRSTIQRLSGPLLDRFELLYYKNRETKNFRKSQVLVSGQDILSRVEQARDFQIEMGFDLPHDISKSLKYEKQWQRVQERHLFESLFDGDSWSYRRQQACLSLAATIADLELSGQIKAEHIEEAFKWTCCNFLKLNKVSC